MKFRGIKREKGGKVAIVQPLTSALKSIKEDAIKLKMSKIRVEIDDDFNFRVAILGECGKVVGNTIEGRALITDYWSPGVGIHTLSIRKSDCGGETLVLDNSSR